MSRSRKIQAKEKIHEVKACINGSKSPSTVAEQFGVHRSVVDDWIRLYQIEGTQVFLPREERRRYDPTLKESAVRDYLSGHGSIREICKKYKIRSTSQLRGWIKVYNGHKDFKKQAGGSRMTKGRETTQAERIEIAKASISSGKNYGEVAIQYNVSYQQVRNWTLKYIEGGEAALEDRRGQRKKDQQPRTELEQAQVEIEQLKHKLKMLEMENHLLKKLEEIERRGR